MVLGTRAPAKGSAWSKRDLWLLAGISVLACFLRFWRLGDWGFDSDEVFMLRDSLSPRLTNPRPLMYFLNYYLIRPVMPLQELSLRLLPAVFGVLAIPTLYLMGRRLAGARAALFMAFLLAVSPLHVYYSQFARYWSLVFLLSAVYPYALYLGVREHSGRWLTVGIVTAIVAVLAHPAAILPLGGFGVWLIANYVRRGQLRQLWGQRRVRWAVLALSVVAILLALRLVSLLQGWISFHDERPGSANEFLLHVPTKSGLKQILYMVGFIESLTLPLVVAAGLGIYLLWLERDRSLAVLLACMFVFPMIFLVLLSFRTPVGVFYLVPTIPIAFIGAGVFLDRLLTVQWELRPSWLLTAAVIAIILAASAPTLLSQYRDGRRYDLRGAAEWLQSRLESGDVIFSDQFQVLTHYLPGATIRRLGGDPAVLDQSVHLLHQSQQGGAVWVVKPAPSHAFRTNPKLGELSGWIYEHCELRNTIGVGRLDFRLYQLQIYRCPVAPPTTAPGNASLRTNSM
jgi:4-amino-4-deoxy-L-arabinose transferase-like glycosyltransferase